MISVKVLQNLKAEMEAEERAGRKAMREGMNAAAKGLQADWRRQVEAGGLGSRLARTIRAQTFPRQPSSNAAALVWTRAPVLLDAFDRGAIIRGYEGTYLAIPTEAAGQRGLGRKRITPRGWEQRTGMELRFVYRRGATDLLVADNTRINTRGRAVLNRRKVRKDGIQTGSQTVPIFIMLPQVQLKKRLDLGPAADRWAARIPGLVVSNWPRT
ncbi:DUF6441 family protein [Roseinatronobacter sp.]|uniref:DUF6441 family protein n=1 Tax=Roseinatronobacter sp. TaxID=1945755 RepID=UPI003F715FF2